MKKLFASYIHATGYGNAVITGGVDFKIEDLEGIARMEKSIEDTENISDVTIINWRRME